MVGAAAVDDDLAIVGIGHGGGLSIWDSSAGLINIVTIPLSKGRRSLARHAGNAPTASLRQCVQTRWGTAFDYKSTQRTST